MSEYLPPPRSLVHAESFTDDEGRPVLRLGCDCATTTDYHIEDAALITGPHEVAFTCEGCNSVRWVTIGPVAKGGSVTSQDLAAMGAYGAFALSSADRLGEMPPWGALPPEARADWRAVADAVHMLGTLAGVTSTHPDGHEAAALQAAAEAIAARYPAWTTGEASGVIFAVLEAAAPHLAAAQREADAQLAEHVSAQYDIDGGYGQPFAALLRGDQP